MWFCLSLFSLNFFLVRNIMCNASYRWNGIINPLPPKKESMFLHVSSYLEAGSVEVAELHPLGRQLSYLINTVADDGLPMQGARSSTGMILTQLPAQNFYGRCNYNTYPILNENVAVDKLSYIWLATCSSSGGNIRSYCCVMHLVSILGIILARVAWPANMTRKRSSWMGLNM